MSNKNPSPKVDAMRALREARYAEREQQIKESEKSDKPKPVKRKKGQP